MNITISGAGFNQDDVTKNSSININSNKENDTKVGHKTFQGVVVSGADQSTAGMDQNTYESLLKQADEVKEQIQQSASTAKDNLKALFKRLSGADSVKIDEDGFNLNDATPDEMVDIVDRIKIELAAHGEQVYSAGAGISTEQIQQVVGSTGLAEDIAGKLQEANLPVSEDNCQEIADTLDMTDRITDLSEDAKNYMVSNQLTPTIENVYKAEHLVDGQDLQGNQNQNTITDQQWQELMPQVSSVIAKAGLEVNDQNLNNAKTFLQMQIPVTEENLSMKAELDQLDLDQITDPEQQSELIGKMAQTMAGGQSAATTLLTDGQDLYSQVADALTTLEQADYRNVADLTMNGKECTIANLKESVAAYSSLTVQETVTWQSYLSYNIEMLGEFQANSSNSNSAQQAENVIDQQQNADTDHVVDITQREAEFAQIVTNYVRLQQVRILMTAQSGYFLAKQGINLQTTNMSTLIQELEQYQQSDFASQLSDSGLLTDDASMSALLSNEAATDGEQTTQDSVLAQMALEDDQLSEVLSGNSTSTTGTVSAFLYQSYQTVVEVKKSLFEIQNAPDTMIGAVIQNSESTSMSISTFAETGSSLRKQYERAGKEYEAVGTEERKDLGDSIKKALKASTDSILDEIGMDHTQDNADAVRILAVNQMEITQDSVTQVKEVYSQLKNLVQNMKPDTVLQMIRDQVNPMDADISEVNQYLQDQNESNTEQNADKYSKFLYKLDQTGGISEEERSQFIGIYKMMNLFQKDAGAAIGSLMKQGSEITMDNLCTAYNSRKAAGYDQSADETTGLATIEGTVNYYKNLFSETGSKLTPQTMKEVNEEQPIMQRQVDNFCEAVQETYDSQSEAAYSDAYLEQLREAADADQSVIRELTQAQQPVSVNQIIAMENISQSGYFGSFMDQEKSDRYVDSIGDREQLEQQYAAEKEEAQENLTAALEATGDQTYESIDQLRMRNQEIGLIENLSMRHDYRIPYATDNGVGTIHLTLVQDAEDTGRISVMMNDGTFGGISLEAKVSDDTAYLYCQTDDQTQSEELQSRLEEIADQMKEQFGLTDVTVQTGTTDKVSRIVYDQAADSVATDRLYEIAKCIVTGLTD